MVTLEGIPSLFPAQPRIRSPKLRIYESLFLWNQGVDQIVATLRGLEKFPFADKHYCGVPRPRLRRFELA
jgi:hypothetical protein